MQRIPFDPYDFFGYLASGLLLIVGMDLVLGFPHISGQDLKVVDAVLLLFGMYIAGQLIATPAKAVLEDGVVDKILGRPGVNLFRKALGPLAHFPRLLQAAAKRNPDTRSGESEK